MTIRFLVLITAVLTFATVAIAQPDPKEDFFTGRDVFSEIASKAKQENWKKLEMGELVGKVGKEFLGTPYVGFTFEIFDDREVCVINLKGLDCATFYEAALALARTIKSKRVDENEFQNQIKRIRYRGGKLGGYVSRLHYAIDYFHDNESKGILNIVTEDIPGALPYEKPISFMSENAELYRQLKANPNLVPEIAKTEAAISKRKTFYIPKEKVAEIEVLLKTGDILGLTIPTKGLDVSHTGICYRDENGVLRFMHASSTQKSVVLDERLSEYLASTKNTGIVVARPLELN